MKYRNYPVECYDDLKQLLKASVDKYRTNTAFLQKEKGAYRAYSYGKFYADVNGLGAELLSMDLTGKRILLMGENSYEWVTSYMAVVCGGGVIVPLNPALSTREAIEITDFTEAAAVICADALCPKFDRANLTVIPFSSLDERIRSGKQRIRQGDRRYLRLDVDSTAVCALMFTSASGVESRGVMLSHRNLCFNITEMRSMVLIGAEDLFLSVLPLHHIYECTCGFLCPLSAGCAVAFSEGLEFLGKNLKEVCPTVMNCVPAMLDGMYRRIREQIRAKGAEGRVRRIIDVTNSLPNLNVQLAAKQKSLSALHRGFGGRLRLMLSGGSIGSEETLKGLRDLGFLVLQGYGATECAPVMALNRDTCFRDTSAGLPTPNALLDIADMQEDGIGEIRYRGDSVMLGYFRMPRRTKEVIRDGWYYTGDVGYIDEDGFLHVLGRLQNVIVTSDGKKIFPEELEALLCRSLAVKEAVVVPVRKNGDGEPCITALIHPDMEQISAQYGADVTREQTELLLRRAVAEVNGTLPDYKRLNAFLLRETEFPKTPTRKIKRVGLADEALRLMK